MSATTPPPPITTTTTATTTTTTTATTATPRTCVDPLATAAPSAVRNLDVLWRVHRSTRKTCLCKSKRKGRTFSQTAAAYGVQEAGASISEVENRQSLHNALLSERLSFVPPPPAPTISTTITTTAVDVPIAEAMTASRAQRIPTMNLESKPTHQSVRAASDFIVDSARANVSTIPSRFLQTMADGEVDAQCGPYHRVGDHLRATEPSFAGQQEKKRRAKTAKKSAEECDTRRHSAQVDHPAFLDFDDVALYRLTEEASGDAANDTRPGPPGQPMNVNERLRVPPDTKDAETNNDNGPDRWYPPESKVKEAASNVRVSHWWLPWLWLGLWFTWWVTWFRQGNPNKLPSLGKSSFPAKWIWLSMLLCSCLSLAQSHDVHELVPHGRSSGICQSLDIRNVPEQLTRLRGCKVIEGNLQLVLMEPTNATQFDSHSYPELTEITGHFLMYRVYGLKTLKHLFPNLSVIRGQTLFYDYALVIFECNDLQDIALPALTDISRGYVRVEKNQNLCYTQTVDWHRIAHQSGDNFIKDNKPFGNCPTRASCPNNCSAPSDSRLCWSNSVCQKLCECGERRCPVPSSAFISTKSNEPCCHPECLGGCTGPENHQCIACKNVSYRNQCKELCPPDTYLFNQRRCLTDTECINIAGKSWIPFDGVCRHECPPGYQINKTESQTGVIYNTCRPCNGLCPKECNGLSVDSIEKVQLLKGCTYIKGALEIHVKGGDSIVRELEESLSLIEEVQDFVKIVRSFPLVSLNFLKNLKKIHGNRLENTEYALVVLDNPNLQELWNWEQRERNLTIVKGKLFFHFNPSLCYDKIKELQNITGLNDTDRRHISSNGGKADCKTDVLQLNITQVASHFATVKWENYAKKMPDPRALLGYVMSYIEAPYQNVTYYSGRDACGGDGWIVDDVESVSVVKPAGADAASVDDDGITHIMVNLKPFTQYAVYVKTFTVSSVVEDGNRTSSKDSEHEGARSPITYFTTRPYDPSNPIQLKAFSNLSSELVVTWKEPATPNGIVTHYLVNAKLVEENRDAIEERNYCSEPLSADSEKVSKTQGGQDNRGTTISQYPSRPDDNGGCCSCVRPKAGIGQTQIKTLESQITFEDYVQNNVYIRRNDGEDVVRKKRESGLTVGREFPENPAKEQSAPQSSANGTLTPMLKDKNERYTSLHMRVNGETTLILRSLRHYAKYTIELKACQDPEPGQAPGQKRCSGSAITTARTLHLSNADEIPFGVRAVVSNHSTGEVKIRWDEPENPNGIIVNYHIEYRRVETDKLKKEVCLTSADYNANGKAYVISSLAPGNYSAEIKATSLYGKSTRPSQIVYFQILEPNTGLGTSAIVGLITVSVIVLVALATAIFYLFFCRKKMGDGGVLYASVNPEYMSTDVYVPDEWEVAREKIELMRELGQGSFGMVYEGMAKDMVPGKHIVKCAVKTVNEKASIRERIEFLNEASVMKAFDSNHVVRLLGVVSKGQPTLVIMELMAYGDLKSYLRSHRPDCEENISHNRLPPTLRCILQMAIEIADGMSYLTAKKFVHRDLAARNCMVADDLTVKIGDFGMTRDIYATDYYRKGGKGLLPVRWMSPESLKDGVFTSQSDVWSYGVVLWEMATLASQPYQGLANEQVLNYVMKGGVMEKPEGCPERMYKLMASCWQFKATDRPTFFDIVESLMSESKPTFEQLSFYSSKQAQDARNAQKEMEEKHLRLSHPDDPSTPLRLTVCDPADGEEVVEMEELEGEDNNEEDSDGGSHVQIMYPPDHAYVRALAGGPIALIRDPSRDMHSHSGSRSDGSHSTGKTLSSEGSKNSHNGSANGYVSGILQHRRNGPDSC